MTTVSAGRDGARAMRAGDRRRGRRSAVAVSLLSLGVAVWALTWWCTAALGAATADGTAHAGAVPLHVAAACFLLAAGAVVLAQSTAFARRLAGPEYRLIQSLRRMRSGDLSFRVSLRRGDLLRDVAEECNAVLEWLNANPPAGTRTGTDVVEVETVENELAEVRS